jgi:hypothetical protein
MIWLNTNTEEQALHAEYRLHTLLWTICLSTILALFHLPTPASQRLLGQHMHAVANALHFGRIAASF